MRQKCRLEKYVEKYCKPDNINEGLRSRYYRFGSRTIRISDHISKNAPWSIIIDSGNPTKYILYIKDTGYVTSLDFNQAKNILKTFKLISNVFTEYNILGYPIEYFSEGQINQIKIFINQNKK